MPETPSHPAPEKKPWPMRWVAAVILAYIVGYTLINAVFRKPEPPHEPFAEAQERREMRTIRASMMGWIRLVAEPMQNFPTAASGPGMVMARRDDNPPPIETIVPQDVMMIAPGKPHLYPAVDELRATTVVAVGEPLRLSVRLPDPAQLPRIGEPLAYAKDGELHIFLQEESDARTHWVSLPATARFDLGLPTEVFGPGPWKATCYTSGAVFTWEFTVE